MKTTAKYQVIKIPMYTPDAKAQFVFDSPSYFWALNHVADLGASSGELVPVNASFCMSLRAEGAMQGWELHEAGEAVALLGIVEAKK